MNKQTRFTLLEIVAMSLTAIFIFFMGSQTARSNGVTAQTANGVPEQISYQGFLTDDAGEPLEGTVALTFGIYALESSGRPFWQELQTDVPVNGGHFSVMLGNVTPLEATVFEDSVRYLQVGVDSGGGVVNLPRQRLTAVPYAFRAETAVSAPWTGLTGIPPGFADGVDNGASYPNQVIVAKNGGDFNSVQAAIDSITDASGESPYLVWIAPGTYSEVVTMKPFVNLKGDGEGITIISSNIASEPDGPIRPSTPTIGTVQLASNSTVRDLTVVNTGTEEFHVALWSEDGVEETVVENVTARVVGNSYVNMAISLNGSDSNIILKNVTALSANGLDSNIGLNVYEATVTLRGGTFTGRGGNGFANGIQNLGGATLVVDSAIVYSEMAIGYGLFNAGSTSTLYGGAFTGGEAGIYNGGTEDGIPSTLFAESVMAKGFSGMMNYGTATLNSGSFISNLEGGRGIVNAGTGLLQANDVYAMAEGNGAIGLVNSGNATVYGGMFIGRGNIEAYGIGGEGIIISHAVVEGDISVGGGSVSHTRMINGVVQGGVTCTAVSLDTLFFESECPNDT